MQANMFEGMPRTAFFVEVLEASPREQEIQPTSSTEFTFAQNDKPKLGRTVNKHTL